ncbi:MAG TPA: DNA-3-methyladenine glycosylase [Microbacteriaceae bacterium]|nr:DNA-3-methyladenine glycosylase [Microbacteriaceae bacterium]
MRAFLHATALEVAPLLLGAVISHETTEGTVGVMLTEVEAYLGDGTDPGSHAYRGKTARNAPMFGEPGHLYAYFTYGMYTCGNIVCSPDGTASGVLMRAGRVVEGVELARSRRSTSKKDHDLARGPALLAMALGVTLADKGADLLTSPFRLELAPAPLEYRSGPRTGLSGPGGTEDFPWRFWLPDEPSVSAYKRHKHAGEEVRRGRAAGPGSAAGR